MYLSTLGRIALRRWMLVVPSILLVAAGLYAVSERVSPEYKQSASVVLIPPESLEEPDSNRYLALGSLDQAVGVLVRTLTSDAVQEQVARKAPEGTYEILADWTTSAPIIVVTSNAPTPADAQAVLTAALSLVPQQLDELQNSIGVLDSQRITSLPLTRDDTPSRVLKPLLRALIATGVVLVALLIGLIATIDGLLLRRERRRRLQTATSAVPADEPFGDTQVVTVSTDGSGLTPSSSAPLVTASKAGPDAEQRQDVVAPDHAGYDERVRLTEGAPEPDGDQRGIAPPRTKTAAPRSAPGLASLRVSEAALLSLSPRGWDADAKDADPRPRAAG